MEFDPAAPVSSAVLENTFKMGQILQIQKKYPQAIEKYLYVCNSMVEIMRKNPETEFHLLVLAISKLVEIYREQQDLDRALAFMKVEKELLETMAARKGTKLDDDEKDDEFNVQEHDMGEMMDHMEKALHMQNDKKSPEEIVQMLLEARKQQERENQEENMKHLLDIVEERKRRYENSRWERFSDWMSDNPVAVIIICMVVLGVFVIGIFVKLGVDQRQPLVGNRHQKKFDTGTPPKKTLDEMKKEAAQMKEAFQKYRESLKQKQTGAGSGKKPFDEL